MSNLTTRNALAEALAAMEPGWAAVRDCAPGQVGWAARQGFLSVAHHKADVLFASGAVIDAATDRAWAERFLYAWATPYFGDDRADAVSAVQRAAAAALTERDA